MITLHFDRQPVSIGPHHGIAFALLRDAMLTHNAHIAPPPSIPETAVIARGGVSAQAGGATSRNISGSNHPARHGSVPWDYTVEATAAASSGGPSTSRLGGDARGRRGGGADSSSAGHHFRHGADSPQYNAPMHRFLDDSALGTGTFRRAAEGALGSTLPVATRPGRGTNGAVSPSVAAALGAFSPAEFRRQHGAITPTDGAAVTAYRRNSEAAQRERDRILMTYREQKAQLQASPGPGAYDPRWQ
jgi:hypothetical protein